MGSCVPEPDWLLDGRPDEHAGRRVARLISGIQYDSVNWRMAARLPIFQACRKAAGAEELRERRICGVCSPRSQALWCSPTWKAISKSSPGPLLLLHRPEARALEFLTASSHAAGSFLIDSVVSMTIAVQVLL